MDSQIRLEHSSTVFKTWKKVQALKSDPSLAIDGQNLDIASVVAVARHGLTPKIKDDRDLRRRLQDSIDTLNLHLQNGWVIYGVNTGFGGSADSRTEQLRKLQVSLLQHTQSAIITSSDKDERRIDRDGQSHVIPREWVKAAILTRANQNLRGHSAVRLEVIENLLSLLRHDIIPLVPLRGTISASGDLMPLSYIAGTLTGSPDIFVRLSSGKVVSSNEALRLHNISPVELAPKEGLGLINGTAPSAATAALVIHEAHHLTLLAQLLTAFTAECLSGNVEWSAPFIHAIRPHPGQLEAAHNIRLFLRSSTFITGLSRKKRTGSGLWQDRYSTRTSPQWIGPYLEDLLLAHRQIETELNSTCDNPVIDSAAGEVFSGGNFQAAAITSALDKTRLALQMTGRMLSSQCAELINPSLNAGLDPNLVFGDPDASYTLKGIDVNMAAYTSELAALAAPVSAHVQSAEMHNQAINSLAFLSARRTMAALDVLAHMVACHAYVCCQAVDLRHYHRRFLAATTPKLSEAVAALTARLAMSEEETARLQEEIHSTLIKAWYHANHSGHLERCDPVVATLMTHIIALPQASALSAEEITGFKANMVRGMQSWIKDPANDPDIPGAGPIPGLGRGSATLYGFVRGTLGVRFHRGLREPSRQTTIGSDVSRIYEALQGEEVINCVMAAFSDAWGADDGEKLVAKL